MNKNFKRSLALILSAAVICSPLCQNDMFTKNGSDSMILSASAANPVQSGYTVGNFTYEDKDQGVTIYFSVNNSKAKTAYVTGCIIKKDSAVVYIPETVKYQNVSYTVTGIGENAFRGQSGIFSVSTPKNITEIGSFAFAGCKNLYFVSPSIAYEDGEYKTILKKIGAKAFLDCETMITPSFFEDVESIGEYAFYNCRGMDSDIALPKISSLGSYAFSGCTGLSKVNLSESNITKVSEGTFQYCSSSASEFIIKLPSTVKTIEKYAFYNVCSLKQIYIPNVEVIGDEAFKNCHQLKDVLTGDNISSIGKQAFYGCDPMDYFVCKNSSVNIAPQALGYDNMRNYTGKKKNFTLWSTNGGGKVKSYAKYYGFTYKDTSEAPKQAIENYQPYMWSCGNVPEMFAEYQNGKKVNSHLYIEGHKPYAEISESEEEHNGSCYGMAAVSTLVYNGYLNVDQFAPGYSRICDLNKNCTDYTRSVINTVWSNYRKTPDYELSHGAEDARFCEKDAEMLKYIEFITYGADPAVFQYAEYPSQGGHAIVCLGMEFKENAKDKDKNKQWNGKDARILLYDVNMSKYYDIGCLYLNLSTGEWNMGVVYTEGTKGDNVYKSWLNTDFVIRLFYKPDSIVSNPHTPEGRLKGMDLVNRVISIRK